jgi:hypothetical protein
MQMIAFVYQPIFSNSNCFEKHSLLNDENDEHNFYIILETQ